ncbi:hypothetical protein [Pararhodobacter oceanensis]|uniref:hypothetical protein n=1 Tax=Pararhodobacter oceanensis TaxID=2172121 RepID=UPI003A902B06
MRRVAQPVDLRAIGPVATAMRWPAPNPLARNRFLEQMARQFPLIEPALSDVEWSGALDAFTVIARPTRFEGFGRAKSANSKNMFDRILFCSQHGFNNGIYM